MWESHPAIDPLTGDLWFVRSDTDFSGWRLWRSRCVSGMLVAPEPAPLAAPGLEADPYFAADGRTLYFISTRLNKQLRSSALDIWQVDRNSNGQWSEPQRLAEPVNSPAAEWFARPAPDGWLYFGSARPGGLGGTDIWRARLLPDASWQVENAGPAINGPGEDYEFAPAPNGRSAVLATDNGLYLVRRSHGQWQQRVRMDGAINANGTEIGPLWAPDSSGFWFSRDLGGTRSGEFLFAASHGISKHRHDLDRCGNHGEGTKK
jgi:WD40-like Beta Propeller Repeat